MNKKLELKTPVFSDIDMPVYTKTNKEKKLIKSELRGHSIRQLKEKVIAL